ncbi:PTPDL family protein [Haloferula sp.]|uniref:PTPDL family protein n=1 Tax=Haloferula sp. TaxID=2497595 RepID=UPI003C752177
MKATTLILIPALACLAHADTIRMRNGTEYEGEVVSEKDDHYVVKIQVTKSIRDERKIPKSEILEIVAEKKDEIAFDEIRGYVPTPDLLTLKQYDQRIADVEKFMSTYPKSSHLKDADKLLKTLDAEREVVAAGGLKFEGNMIKASERTSKAYPLDARIAAAKVVEYGDAGNTTAALRAWSDLEQRFGSSSAYADSIPYVLKMMSDHLKKIERSLSTYDQRVKEREDGLTRIAQRDQERTKRAIADQSAAYTAKLAQEKEEKVKWPSLDPYHKQPMSETKRMLESEITKLDRFDPARLPNGEDAWNNAWQAVNGSADPQEATKAISEARSARLPDEYIIILESRAPKK